MSYPPLAEVRKDLRVEWYRSPIEGAKLRELSRRSDLQGLYQAGGHLALFLLTGAVTYFFWLQQIWGGCVHCAVLPRNRGNVLRGVAGHELVHGSVFRTKILNKAFLYVFSLLGWWDILTTRAAIRITTATPCTPTVTARSCFHSSRRLAGHSCSRYSRSTSGRRKDAFSVEAAAFWPRFSSRFDRPWGRWGSTDEFRSEWWNSLNADQP